MRKILDLNDLPSGRRLDLNWNVKANMYEATLLSKNGNRLRSDYGHNRLTAVANLIACMRYSAYQQANERHRRNLNSMARELADWLEVK